MQVFFSTEDIDKKFHHSTLVIGNFDGLHLAHQKLISWAKKKCENFLGVLTFSPHPQEIIFPEKKFFYLTDDQQRKNLFEKFGVDFLVMQKINKNFLQQSAEEFVEKILIDQLKCKKIFIGDDFKFGKGALGNFSLLKNFAQKKNFSVEALPEVLIEGIRCSSSIIREQLIDGQVKGAQKFLGRPFSLMGRVVRGQGKGKTLGFRTSNIIPRTDFLLKRGVYLTQVKIGSQKIFALTNVGVRPTISQSNSLVVESHLFDHDASLYDQIIEVNFLERLRDEKKFNDATSLSQQIQKDSERALQMIHRYTLQSASSD